MPEPATEGSSASPNQSLPAGTRLEEFVIERVLGVGGFGITYLARDQSLGRQVVIKENLPSQFCWRDSHALTVRPRHTEGEDAENFQYSLESFRKEASTLASLDHPGIVKVLRSFKAHGTAYFVMPFVAGTALDEVLRQRTEQRKAFTENEIKALLTKVLDALGYLHDRGIYHRDIKPGNILMTNAGPVLIDFGAARQRLSERSLTVIESAGYTPFEQLQSRGKVGPWSDIYALGGTLYKALTGETAAKATDRAFDDPQVPLAQRPKLQGIYSARLLESIDQAMAPKASDRFQDTAHWRDCLGTSKTITPPHEQVVTPPPVPVGHTSSGNSLHEEHERILAEAVAAIARNDARAVVALFEQLEGKRFVDLDYSQVKKFVLKRKDRQTSLVAGAIILTLLMLGGWAGLAMRNERIEKEAAVAATTRLVEENANAEAVRIAQEKTATEDKKKVPAMAIDPTQIAVSSNVELPTNSEMPDQRAANAGDIDAQFRMGIAYATGRGVLKDDQQASQWFEKASAQGHKGAELQLQNLRPTNAPNTFSYDAEQPVRSKSPDQQAAENGDIDAQFRLGIAYATGRGVPQNDQQAAVWFEKASAQGHKGAELQLQNIRAGK